jgi:histidinol-phosphate aminotransferase
MATGMDRRQWLKSGALAAGGLLAGFNGNACRVSGGAADAGERSDKLTPPDFAKQPVVDSSVVRLKSNESPYGLSTKAREAATKALDLGHIYPHDHYARLKAQIAGREGVTPEHIILGAGSTEIMVMLIQLYGSRGEALAADPTYFDFVSYAEKADCLLRQVPLDEYFVHDLAAMEKEVGSRTSLVYVCNPTNPTGTIVGKDRLIGFCEKVSRTALVVVDEAYHEYVDDPMYASMLPLVKQGANVVVTRTFSKIYGMAGMRVGYGVAASETINRLRKIQRNFATLAYPSLEAAVTSHSDMEFQTEVREKNREVKHYAYRELERLGLDYIPSHTNFILFQIDRDAREAVEAFKSYGVLLRGFPIRGKNWIRVSLGTRPEMERFVSVLERITG